MRLVTLLLLISLNIGCTSGKKATSNSNPLNGAWVPVQQEIGGMAMPPNGFEKQKLIISDSNYTFSAESVDKGVVNYNNDKMDIYGKEGVNKGKHFTAIYKYENGQLSICYNLAGNGYPDGFVTKGKPTWFLSVFKKE